MRAWRRYFRKCHIHFTGPEKTNEAFSVLQFQGPRKLWACRQSETYSTVKGGPNQRGRGSSKTDLG